MTCLEQSSGVYIEDEHPVKQFILKYSYEGGGIQVKELSESNGWPHATTWLCRQLTVTDTIILYYFGWRAIF